MHALRIKPFPWRLAFKGKFTEYINIPTGKIPFNFAYGLGSQLLALRSRRSISYAPDIVFKHLEIVFKHLEMNIYDSLSKAQRVYGI